MCCNLQSFTRPVTRSKDQPMSGELGIRRAYEKQQEIIRSMAGATIERASYEDSIVTIELSTGRTITIEASEWLTVEVADR